MPVVLEADRVGDDIGVGVDFAIDLDRKSVV